jgi:hypothetical protein
LRTYSFGVGGRVVTTPALDHPAIDRADPEARQTFLVEEDLIVIVDLDDVNVGNDVPAALDVVFLSRSRIEPFDDLDLGEQVFHRKAQGLGELLVRLFWSLSMWCRTMVSAALPSSPRCRNWMVRHSMRSAARDAHGVQALDELQRGANLLGRKAPHGLELLDARTQIAVFVEVADDRAPDLLLALGRSGHVELPDEMPGEILSLGQGVLERRKGFARVDRGPGDVPALDVLEVGLVVDVVERIARLRLRGVRGPLSLCRSGFALVALGDGPSSIASSRTGFSVSSCWISSTSSSLDIWRSLIACWSDGVMMSRWLILTLSLCSRAIGFPALRLEDRVSSTGSFRPDTRAAPQRRRPAPRAFRAGRFDPG